MERGKKHLKIKGKGENWIKNKLKCLNIGSFSGINSKKSGGGGGSASILGKVDLNVSGWAGDDRNAGLYFKELIGNLIP